MSTIDIASTVRIQTIYRRSYETYGSPNIHAELADEIISAGACRW